jgi:hypothetical protein
VAVRSERGADVIDISVADPRHALLGWRSFEFGQTAIGLSWYETSISRDLTTFVLIPGAGIDPGAWRWTVAELEARGHRGLAPPLPLDDPDAGPSAHADAVTLGAFSASLVAARIEVSELVLVAPMVPAPGETAGDWWAAVRHSEAIAPLIQRLGAMSEWGPEELTEVFLHDVPAAIASAAAQLNAIPGPGMFREPWPLSAWPKVPTRVLAPRDDRLFPLAFQRRVVRRRLGLPVEEMPGGHVPMLARPGELAVRLAATSDRVAGHSSRRPR